MTVKVREYTATGAKAVATKVIDNVHYPIYGTGITSTGNSSTTLLTSSSTFTGDWEDVSAFNSVVVAVKTDQDGTFTVQFSPDGVNADSTLTRYYRTGNIEAPHRFTITRQYCRVTFTNTAASDQTYLRLQTMYGDSGDLNAPCDSTLAPDFDAIVTRPTDYRTEVALGRRQGAALWNKFGYNQDVDTATDPEIIASWGGTFQYLTAGETLSIVSTSTNDDASPATGAQQVVVTGVDSNWDEIIEIVTMDGTTPVVTSGSFIGVNRIAIYAAGTGKTNAGTITATASGSGYTMAQMPVGNGTTQQCIFYVPQNRQFLMEWLYLNALKEGPASAPIVTFKGWVYSAVSNAEYEVFRGSLDTTASTEKNLDVPLPFVVGEKSIIWFTAETDQNDTVVRGRFSGILHKDVDA